MQNNGPVMDVQRPRENATPPGNPAPLEKPMAPADNIAGQAPLTAPTPNSSQPKKKRTGLIVGVITGVLILVIGLGVGGFIWYKSTHKPAPAAAPTQTQTDNRVDEAEIDATTAEIDKTMNTLNDSTDVTPSDVNDSTLGL